MWDKCKLYEDSFLSCLCDWSNLYIQYLKSPETNPCHGAYFREQSQMMAEGLFIFTRFINIWQFNKWFEEPSDYLLFCIKRAGNNES